MRKFRAKLFVTLHILILSLFLAGCFGPPSDEEQEKAFKEWGAKFYGEFLAGENYYKESATVYGDVLDNKIPLRSGIDKMEELYQNVLKSHNKIDKMEIPKILSPERQEKLKETINNYQELLKYDAEICKNRKNALEAIAVKNKAAVEASVNAFKQNMDLRDKKVIMAAMSFTNFCLGEFKLAIDHNTPGYFVKQDVYMANNPPMTSGAENNVQTSAPSAATKTTNTSSNLETAKKQLEYRGIMGNVVATSYGHSSKGFLAQYDDGNIVLLDKMTNRVIKVSPPDAIKRIADYQGSGNTSVKLELLIMNDTRDSDEKSGVWKGNNHLLPVTVEYKYENGAHIPGMIKSGAGASPAAYNNYLYETKNVDAVNMIIEEAAVLK